MFSSKSILLFAVGLFGFSSAYSVDASAQASPQTCVMWVSSQNAQRDQAFKNLGFEVKPLPRAIQQLTTKDFSNLLAKGDFFLNEAKQEIWFSLGGDSNQGDWKPLSIKAPAAGQTPPASYSCKNLKSQMQFFRQGRAAISEAYSLLNGKPASRLVGDTFLELERVFFLHKGVGRFDFVTAKERYANMLAQAKKIRANRSLEFFEQWTELRRTVFGKDKFNTNYCADKTTIIEALQDLCTNCVGETFLLYALFKDAGFELPKDWKLGLQSFKDHLRLVAFDKQNQRTHDLATGKFEDFKAAIYEAEILPISLLAGHPALKFDSEKTWIQKQKPKPVYSSWSCLIPKIDLRPTLRPSNLDMLPGCEKFGPDDAPPEYASNQSKTDVPAEATPGVANSGAGAGQNSDGKSFGAGLKDLLSMGIPDFSGFFADAPTWYLYVIRIAEGEQKRMAKLFLTAYASGLNEEEEKILVDGLEKNKVTEDVVRSFSQGSLMARLGYSHYRQRAEFLVSKTENGARDPAKWDSPLLPLFVSDGRSNSLDAFTKEKQMSAYGLEDRMRIRTLGEMQNGPDPVAEREAGSEFFCAVDSARILNCKMKVYPCNGKNGVCLDIRDPSLLSQFKSLSAVERTAKLLEMFKTSFSRAANLDVSPLALVSSAPQAIQTADLSNINQDMQAFLRFYSSQYVMSEFGFQFSNTPSRNPLNDALVRSVGLENFDRILSYHDQWITAVSENTAATLKALDQMSREQKLRLSVQLNQLKTLVYTMNNISDSPAFTEMMQRHETSHVDIRSALLSSVLYHPKYYFTVEPESDERIPGRPYSPWRIEDPRVQDLKKSVIRNQLPQVDLPRIAGVGRCGPDEKGYKFVNGFYIQCESTNEKSDDKNYESKWNQNGLVENPQGGEALRRKHGQDDKLVESGIQQSQHGFESQGQTAFDRPMTEKEKQLRVRESYTQVIPDGNPSADTGLVDPRQEVHLQPATWGLFVTKETLQGDSESLESSNWDQMILLHHAYRKKLAKVFNFTKFIPWQAYERDVFSLPTQYVESFIQDYTYELCDGSCKAAVLEDLWNWVEQAYNSAVYEQPFVAVAKEELLNPKAGWVVSTTTESNISGEDTLIALGRLAERRKNNSNGFNWQNKAMASDVTHPGILFPVVGVVDGVEYPVQTNLSPYLVTLMSKDPTLGKNPNAQFASISGVGVVTHVTKSEPGGKFDFALSAVDRRIWVLKKIGPDRDVRFTRQTISKLMDSIASLSTRPKIRSSKILPEPMPSPRDQSGKVKVRMPKEW